MRLLQDAGGGGADRSSRARVAAERGLLLLAPVAEQRQVRPLELNINIPAWVFCVSRCVEMEFRVTRRRCRRSRRQSGGLRCGVFDSNLIVPCRATAFP